MYSLLLDIAFKSCIVIGYCHCPSILLTEISLYFVIFRHPICLIGKSGGNVYRLLRQLHVFDTTAYQRFLLLAIQSQSRPSWGSGNGSDRRRDRNKVPLICTHANAIIDCVPERHNHFRQLFRPYNVRLLIFRSARGPGKRQGSYTVLY